VQMLGAHWLVSSRGKVNSEGGESPRRILAKLLQGEGELSWIIWRTTAGAERA